MTTTHHSAHPSAHDSEDHSGHRIEDERETANSLVMAMVGEVIHDGTGAGCPGCIGHGSWHDGEEALAA